MSANDKPVRVAVIGSGPAGFYAAGALLAADLAGRGRPVRAPPDAVGARAPRRRARPPEDQDGLARVREDRRAARVPLLRQRRGRARPEPRRAPAPLRRRRLHGRRADRPADRDPGRGPTRLVAGDRVRRLVQRPPRLPGPHRSTSPASAWSWSAPATSRSTSRGCSRSPRRSSAPPTRPTRRSTRSSARGSPRS